MSILGGVAVYQSSHRVIAAQSAEMGNEFYEALHE